VVFCRFVCRLQAPNFDNLRAKDVAKFIDERDIGGFQILVLGLCFIVMVIDGFDAQAIGFIAPLISMEWGVANASFGPVVHGRPPRS
jgi:hypothetical protein